MINIDKESLRKLNEQQDLIIQSEDSKIVVQAGPGSGKTYTMIKMIERKIDELEDYEGIIACSFTREASQQLQIKIEKLTDSKNNFVGTIDSFIFNEILNPAKNRLLNLYNRESIKNITKTTYGSQNSKLRRLTIEGITAENEFDIRQYCNYWLDQFSLGNYEISFPAYLYAKDVVGKVNAITKHIKNKYKIIYIDEAQDLNYYQHLFIHALIEKCSLDIVVIGDENQSIYEFRGARPELFSMMEEKQKYKAYEITYSIRCHKSILDYSHLIINEDYEAEKTLDCRVAMDVYPNIEMLQGLKNNFFILVETQKLAQEIYEEIEGDIEIIYSRPFDLDDSGLNEDDLQLVEAIVKFFLNINHSNRKLIYSLDEYLNALNFYIDTERIQINRLIPKENEDVMTYIKRITSSINFEVDLTTLTKIEEELHDQIVINHYTNFDEVNRLMTIHGSKGLEADTVFVVLGSPYYGKVDDTYRRKLFVGFSRAKNRLYISERKNNYYPEDFQTIYNILKKNLNRLETPSEDI